MACPVDHLKFLSFLKSKRRITTTWLFILFILTASCQNDEEINPFFLSVKKQADTQAFLHWAEIEGADNYKIWRTIDKARLNDPELIGTVDNLTYTFSDMDLPLYSQLTYYITTNVNGTEQKSIEITVAGSSQLMILPYQMKLIPEKNLAIIRDYSVVFLVDYEKKAIIKKLAFAGKLGQFDLSTYNGKHELYLPCSDNNIYILNSDNLAPIDTIQTGKPVSSVAVNSLGKIFCSGSYDFGRIKVYERESLSLITDVVSEFDCGLFLQNDNNLVVVTSHQFPATMSYFTFNDDGFPISKTDDPYAWDYEIQSERLKVSDKFIVTSTEGFIYTADESMTYVATITAGGSNQSDFEFSADGTTIYSTVTDQKVILKSTVNSNNVVSSTGLATTGYPWIMSRTGNTLIVLSSPVPFHLYSLTNGVIIEKILLP